jgi:NCS1 family nucleobase:cation symporter-1
VTTEATITPQGYKENPDLMPVPADQRAKGYNLYTWTFMMFSMNTCIPMFFLGPIGGGLGLSLWQVLAGALIGNFAAVVVMFLNGMVGVKYAIPYPVQLRESFGFKGIHLPVLIRGISGTMWFGIEVWAGSYALTLIALWALGVANWQTAVFTWMVPAVIVYLVLLVAVMRYGLRGIGRMADFAGPLMILYFVWLAYFLATQSQFSGNIPGLYVSTASYFSVSFLLYLAVQTNWWATVALNISDLSRGMHPKKSGAFFWGLIIGVVLCQGLGTILGFAVTQLTGTTLPQDTILKYAGSGLGILGGIAVVVGLIFAFLAPWSTDITANVPPLIDIFIGSLKVRWKTAVVFAGIVGFIVTPWWAVSAGSQYTGYIQGWAGDYGILLGPIAGIMIGSYWINRKHTLDLQKMYTSGPNSYFKGGWGRAAYLSWISTVVVCYIIAILMNMAWSTGPWSNAFLAYLGAFPFPASVTWYFAVLFGVIFQVLYARALKE